MSGIPTKPTNSFARRNPHLYGYEEKVAKFGQAFVDEFCGPKPTTKPTKPLLNKTEERCLVILEGRGLGPIFKQAFTLRMDPPYKSYTPDLAFLMNGCLNFVEVKGPHRFRRAGIAKAALAAKTYPLFKFWLHEWDGKEWKQSLLTP